MADDEDEVAVVIRDKITLEVLEEKDVKDESKVIILFVIIIIIVVIIITTIVIFIITILIVVVVITTIIFCILGPTNYSSHWSIGGKIDRRL